MVLEYNRVREVGTHEELIKIKSGLYRKLYNVQRQLEPVDFRLNQEIAFQSLIHSQ